MKIERMQYNDSLYSHGTIRKTVARKKGSQGQYSIDPDTEKQKQQFQSANQDLETIVEENEQDPTIVPDASASEESAGSNLNIVV